MRRIRPLIALAVLAVAVSVLPILSAQAAPPVLHNVLTMDNAAGVYGGVSTVDTQVSMSTRASAIEINGGRGIVDIAPPTGTTLAVGTYTTAHTATATHAAFELTDELSSSPSPSMPCTTEAGTLTIAEITFDDTQNVTAFAASYSDICNGAPAIMGELRVNSDIGYTAAVETNPHLFGLQQHDHLAPATVTITAATSATLILRAAVLSGPNAASFTTTTDTCSNTTLSNGASCTVTFTPKVTAPGTYTATLTIPDNTLLGYRLAQLNLDADAGGAGTFRINQPVRVLDTRIGHGAPKTPLGPGRTIAVTVIGAGGIPSEFVSAVVLNVTVTGATRTSFLTVYPDGSPRPTASNLNVVAGRTQANAVTVAVGGTGKVDFYNSTGTVQVIADESGSFYANDINTDVGGDYHPLTPTRILDTRTSTSPTRGTPLPANSTIMVPVNLSPALNSHISAVAVNITAVHPTQAGYLSAWNGTDYLETSTLNFPAGATVPNMAIVQTGTCGPPTCAPNEPELSIHNASPGRTYILVDLLGYFDDGTLHNGLRFHPIVPTRITDTRSHLGAPAALGPDATDTITTPHTITDTLTAALALNITAITPSTGTFLTLWPTGGQRPTASTLNPATGQTVANASIVGLNTTNQFNIYNNLGTTNLVIDVAGTYDHYQFLPTTTP